MDEPRPAAGAVTAIGSLLASTSGALVAVQVGLWLAERWWRGPEVPSSIMEGLLLSAGVLVLGVVTFVTSLALVSQGHPSTYGRRAISWAAVGFVAMTGWALGFPLLVQG